MAGVSGSRFDDDLRPGEHPRATRHLRHGFAHHRPRTAACSSLAREQPCLHESPRRSATHLAEAEHRHGDIVGTSLRQRYPLRCALARRVIERSGVAGQAQPTARSLPSRRSSPGSTMRASGTSGGTVGSASSLSTPGPQRLDQPQRAEALQGAGRRVGHERDVDRVIGGFADAAHQALAGQCCGSVRATTRPSRPRRNPLRSARSSERLQ